MIKTICKYHVETSLARHHGRTESTGIQKSRAPNQAATTELCGLAETVCMGLFSHHEHKSWDFGIPFSLNIQWL